MMQSYFKKIHSFLHRTGWIELITLSTLYLVMVGIWVFLLSWDGSKLIIGQDGVSHHLPTVTHIFSHDPLLPFHFGVGGGIALYPVTGIVSFEYLLYLLGLDITQTINFSLILIQTLTVYFLLKFIKVWRQLRFTDYLFSTVLIGFAPVLIMRFNAGHVNFILSSMLVPMSLYLVSAVRKNIRFGFIELLIIVFSMSQIFGYLAHQGIYYTALCLFPIFLFIICYRKKKSEIVRSFIVLLLIKLSAIAFAFMELKSQLTFFRADELSRNIKDKMAAFSFLAPNLERWRASLFYSLDTISTEHQPWQIHELSYPFFALVFTFIVINFRSKFRLKIFAMTMIPAVILFLISMKTPFITDFILNTLPGFASFRVIQRFMIPFLLLVTSLLILFIRTQKRTSPKVIIVIIGLIAAGALAHHLSSGFSILIEIAICTVFLISLKYPQFKLAALALLSGISLNASIERVPAYTNLHAGQSAFKNIKGLTHTPLERTEFKNGIRIPNNVGLHFDIPTLSFYSNPSRNFSELVGLFTKKDETYTMTFNFRSENTPAFLKALYNANTQIEYELGGLTTQKQFESKMIRFPKKIINTTALEIVTLADDERSTNDFINDALDADVTATTIPEHCHDLIAQPLRTDLEELSFELKGKTNGCYAVLPLNHSSLYTVTERTPDSSIEMPLDHFVSHKTLLGIKLNTNTSRIFIRPKNLLDAKTFALEKIIGLIFVFLLYLYFRMSKPKVRALDERSGKI